MGHSSRHINETQEAGEIASGRSRPRLLQYNWYCSLPWPGTQTLVATAMWLCARGVAREVADEQISSGIHWVVDLGSC